MSSDYFVTNTVKYFDTATMMQPKHIFSNQGMCIQHAEGFLLVLLLLLLLFECCCYTVDIQRDKVNTPQHTSPKLTWIMTAFYKCPLSLPFNLLVCLKPNALEMSSCISHTNKHTHRSVVAAVTGV